MCMLVHTSVVGELVHECACRGPEVDVRQLPHCLDLNEKGSLRNPEPTISVRLTASIWDPQDFTVRTVVTDAHCCTSFCVCAGYNLDSNLYTCAGNTFPKRISPAHVNHNWGKICHIWWH